MHGWGRSLERQTLRFHSRRIFLLTMVMCWVEVTRYRIALGGTTYSGHVKGYYNLRTTKMYRKENTICSYQWLRVRDHSFCNFNDPCILSIICKRSSACLFMQWEHKIYAEDGFSLTSRESNSDTFVNIIIFSKKFQSIGKEISIMVFCYLDWVYGSRTYKMDIKWIVRCPLLVIKWWYLNYVLHQ